MRGSSIIVAICLALLSLGTGAAGAATLQPIGNFEQPIYVTSDPGNPDVLFVVERAGRILKLQGGVTSTFADISQEVSIGPEGGLLSIALSPVFDSSGRLYVDYTGTEIPPEIHIAELRVSGGSAP
ncbi:MAG: hypothetical protein QOF23_1883, partial [Solirubrobacterales bacterium]|nr:hypothetical protein [Solirubrobacterales bacterium]